MNKNFKNLNRMCKKIHVWDVRFVIVCEMLRTLIS